MVKISKLKTLSIDQIMKEITLPPLVLAEFKEWCESRKINTIISTPRGSSAIFSDHFLKQAMEEASVKNKK